MDGTESNTLDRAYLTIDDFLNSKHIRSDDVDHTLSPDDLEIHFNKPGFDLAIIITDTSLIQTIAGFQAPFQSKHGFTTHVIYLPDLSRLKFCIRDLKLHEILYAIVVNESSIKADDYDLFILSDMIEYQKSMPYKDAVNLINDDFVNYMEQVKGMLSIPKKYPHAKNTNLQEFVEPSDYIRYLLCLLYDNRMLESHELLDLSKFVKLRKEALSQVGNRQISYSINERPISSLHQDKFKYYIYEQDANLNINTGDYFNNENRQIKQYGNMPKNNASDSDMRFHPPPIGQPRSAPGVMASKPPTIFNPQVPMINNSFSKTAIISSAPKLYTNTNVPPPMQLQSTSNAYPSKNLFQKPVVKSAPYASPIPAANKGAVTPQTNKLTPPAPTSKAAAQAQKVALKTLSNQAAQQQTTTNIPQTTKAMELSMLEKRKIKFSINAATKPPPITHSNVAHNQTSTKNNISGLMTSTNPATQNRNNTINDKTNSTNTFYDDLNPELDEDGNPIIYHLSPVSSTCSENMDMQDCSMAIDLTDDVDSSDAPQKKRKLNQITKNITGLINDTSSTLARTDKSGSLRNTLNNYTTFLVNMDGFVQFFKFVLGLAPFSLPEHNVVMLLMKKCLIDMERYVNSCGQTTTAVDVRACRSGGCADIVRMIEQLCGGGQSIDSKQSVEDLSFMWTYFPRSVTDTSITIMFYKLMKMLELTKLDPASNAILINMIQRVEHVVNFNFKLPASICQPYALINFFASLFHEYFGQKGDLKRLNMSLLPPEQLTVTFNRELDMVITENKIKFMVGPLLEFFVKKINSIHYDLDSNTMEAIYSAVRVARFSLRKISLRLLPECMTEEVNFVVSSGGQMTHTIGEINLLIKEVKLFNCILFTKRHYDLINLLLDFSVKIDSLVVEDTDLDPPDRERIIELDHTKFIHELASSVKNAVLAYHPDTEIEVLKCALKNRWIDTLHQALKGVAGDPDGSRIAYEISYLLPKSWGKHTFGEAVAEAALLSYSDWDKMLTNDFSRARQTYSDVRNNYLIWLSNNGLESRKAMECMTAYQKQLDAKIVMLSS